MIDLMEIYEGASHMFAQMYEKEHTKRIIEFVEKLANKYNAKWFVEEVYYEGYEVFVAFEDKKELQDELFRIQYGDNEGKGRDKEIEKLSFNSLFYDIDKMKVELYFAKLNSHLTKTNMEIPIKEEIEKEESK
jgi:hypothetical protein